MRANRERRKEERNDEQRQTATKKARKEGRKEGNNKDRRVKHGDPSVALDQFEKVYKSKREACKAA